jgi:ABC-type branched-subunit amino acid transport system permease subunit
MTRARAVVRSLAPAAVVILVQQLAFPSTGPDGGYQWGLVLRGVTLGLLSALVALGMALVYRAHRVINFAQGDLGLVPVTLAVYLILLSGVSYFAGLALGLGAAVVVGAVVEMAVIRRFFRAPRLALTVATIGLAQLLAFAALELPRLWDDVPESVRIDLPLGGQWDIAPFTFDADDVAAWVVAPLAMVALALFLRRTDVGVATRAAADRADRAALLGIPVGRIHTYVWMVATVLSFVALFLRAGIVGLPLGSPVGLTVLLSALAALVLGRMTDLVGIAASAVALGVLETHVSWNDELTLGPIHLDLGSEFVIAPVLAVVILVGMACQRRGVTRAEGDDTSSWRASEEVRPLARSLRRLPEVRAARVMAIVAGAAFLVALPYLPWVGDPGNTLKAGAVLIFAVIVLSIAIVTGWAGQVSLGQMAIVAIGAALAAKAATEWGLDLALAAPLMGVVGAVVAVLVGLPALRLRGIHLAVSTLAFAVATVHYFLNPQFFDWVPTQGFRPEPLLGRWDYAATTEGTYQLCLGFFVLCVAAVSGIRQSRVGRAMHALREDEQVAEAYGISVARAKLAAFAVSGCFAGMAGAVLVHHNHQFTLGLFPVEENVTTFSAAVVGGMGSITGAVLGAVFLKGGQWFLQGDWRLFASATGVLIVLLLVPGGLGGALFRARDLAAAAAGRRRGIDVGAPPPDTPLTAAPPVDQPAPEPVQPVTTGGVA